MKKIILLVAVFTIALGLQMQAQVSPTVETEKVEKIDKKEFKNGIVKNKKDRSGRVGKKRKHARKAHITSMKKVAMADGVITKEEKAVIKSEKKKMKRKAVKRRSHAKEGQVRKKSDSTPRLEKSK